MPKNIEDQFKMVVQGFLSGDISAPTFELEYASLWRKFRDSGEYKLLDNDIARRLDRVFSALDCYCADPDLRDEGDLDDNGLMREVRTIIAEP